jgi:hypothetical protein
MQERMGMEFINTRIKILTRVAEAVTAEVGSAALEEAAAAVLSPRLLLGQKWKATSESSGISEINTL